MNVELNIEYRLSPKVKIIWMLDTIIITSIFLFVIFLASSLLGIINIPLLSGIFLYGGLFVLFFLFIYLIAHYIYVELKWRNFTYMFTENNLVLKYGIITKKIERIPYVKIQNITIRYDIIHRILNVGQVIVSTAATDIKLSEFPLDAVDDPESFVNEAIKRIEGVSGKQDLKKRRLLKD